MTAPRFVEVALPLPLRQSFTYRLPAGLQENAQTGARLLVPFGKHICTGKLPKCSTCPVLEYCRQVGVTTHR